MHILTTRSLFTALLLGSLLGLSGCEPKGPTADIGDNIEQVKDEAPATEANASESSPSASSEPINSAEQPIRTTREQPLETELSAPTNNTVPNTDDNSAIPNAASETEIKEQQALQSELNNVVTEEIDQKLDAILKETSDQP
ncbi:MAG: hypothetical protein H9917_11665 [Candidatus Oceanisphaera merdipullorum]|nr:hypothetical protein [Candidatus Oceanisphaera merdipullorum]